MAELQEETPELPELCFVKCHINGLRESTKFQVRPYKHRQLLMPIGRLEKLSLVTLLRRIWFLTTTFIGKNK